MKITVKTLNQEIFSVEMKEDALVSDLRKEISTTKNHPFDFVTLIFKGTILKNDQKILDCKIVDGCNLVAVFQKPKTDQAEKNNCNEST